MKTILALVLGAATALLVATGVAAQSESTRSTPQIDALVAPIALYPDALVAHVLVAATHPIQIVVAERWLQAPDNAGRQGKELDDALATQLWDPSVKALAVFPSILAMMNRDLSWTEALGDAYSKEPDAVMDAIQTLRRRALEAGNLQSTPQQTLTIANDSIGIDPAVPNMVYVPYYDPRLAYGVTQWADYPRADFAWPDLSAYGRLPLFISYVVVHQDWHRGHCDWHRHRIHFTGGSRQRSVLATGSAPVRAIPAPITAIPAPVTAIPAPVTAIPAPVTAIPAPVTTMPARAPAPRPVFRGRPAGNNRAENGSVMQSNTLGTRLEAWHPAPAYRADVSPSPARIPVPSVHGREKAHGMSATPSWTPQYNSAPARAVGGRDNRHHR